MEYSVASLSAELSRYQEIVCQTCRENIIRSTPTGFAQSASQPLVTANSTEPTPSEISQEPFLPISSSLGARRYPQSSGINKRARVHSPRRFVLTTRTSPDNPQSTLPHLPTPTSQPFRSISETTPSTGSTLSNSDDPEWPEAVEYNPRVKQDLTVHKDNTFQFTHKVYCTTFSRDGKLLAVGLGNGETHVYNMMSGSKIVLARRSAAVFCTDAPEVPPKIWTARISSDNKYIATGGGDSQINIWELDRRRLRASFKNESLVNCIDFAPNNRFLVSASDDLVCMWRTRDGWRTTLFQQKFSDFTSAVFSPDGRYVAAGNDGGFLRIWDARTFRLVMVPVGDGMDLRSVRFMPDGKGIATGGKTVQCWSLSSRRREIHSGRQQPQMDLLFEFKGQPHCDNLWITAVSFSSDNRWVVASSLDHNLYILDARSGVWVCTLEGHNDRVWGVDFSPARDYIVSGGMDRCVRLWRYESSSKFVGNVQLVELEGCKTNKRVIISQ